MDNALTEKVGPLPAWGWLVVALVLTLFVAAKFKGKASGSTATTAQQQQIAAAEAQMQAQVASTPVVQAGGGQYGWNGYNSSPNGYTGQRSGYYSYSPAASQSSFSSSVPSTAPAPSGGS